MTLRPEHIEEALNKKTFDEIDPDEVLKHYGYKPEEVHCNGVGIGVWRKEEAFQKLGDIGAFMRFVDHKAKVPPKKPCTKNEQCRHTFEITHERCAPCSGYDTNCERYEKTKGAADTKTS